MLVNAHREAYFEMRAGTVDCEVQKDVCTKEGIPSYPVMITYNADNMAGEWPGAVYEKVQTCL